MILDFKIKEVGEDVSRFSMDMVEI